MIEASYPVENRKGTPRSHSASATGKTISSLRLMSSTAPSIRSESAISASALSTRPTGPITSAPASSKDGLIPIAIR